MPELPEVECFARDLRKCVKGRKIETVQFFFTGMLRGVTSEGFCRMVNGKVFQDVRRRGKYLFFYLSGELVWEVHLRMTGYFLFYPAPAVTDKHTRALFILQDAYNLQFQDIRKFGTFRLWQKEDFHTAPAIQRGIDPLEDVFNLHVFQALLHKCSKRSLKNLLLDQKVITGLGNIYCDEALFRAGLHPAIKAGDLSQDEIKRLFNAILGVLKEGIRLRGTSTSDYRDIWGKKGKFQDFLQVYRRKDKPCFLCGETIIREVIAGRGTHYCPRCQNH